MIMANENKPTPVTKAKMTCNHHGCHGGSGNSSAIYGLGVIGALFYFLENTHGLIPILTGIVKAIFWPAFVVYQLLAYLKI
jgi:hypothetical protein